MILLKREAERLRLGEDESASLQAGERERCDSRVAPPVP